MQLLIQVHHSPLPPIGNTLCYPLLLLQQHGNQQTKHHLSVQLTCLVAVLLHQSHYYYELAMTHYQ
jgi:hypothetical protein